MRGKRHIRLLEKDESSSSSSKLISNHSNNIQLLTNLINKKNVSNHEMSILIEIYQAIKISNDDDLGLDLLDTLETVNFE